VLPAHEAFELAVKALALFPADVRHHHLHCLFVLRNPGTPAWIERNACSPVVNTWGRLAAACNVDWATTQHWLCSGRPLSLVALDSIVERLPHPGRGHRQRPPPRLLVPGGAAELAAALQRHLEKDQSPRVQQRTAVGLSRLADIVVSSEHAASDLRDAGKGQVPGGFRGTPSP
jgi:hypothetical protein